MLDVLYGGGWFGSSDGWFGVTLALNSRNAFEHDLGFVSRYDGDEIVVLFGATGLGRRGFSRLLRLGLGSRLECVHVGRFDVGGYRYTLHDRRGDILRFDELNDTPRLWSGEPHRGDEDSRSG